jgi:LPXTG-motif cell wall-anchored protein
MNKTSNLLNRKRSSFLAFVAMVAVAMFASAPAAMAQIPFSFDGGLDFNNNDVVCDRVTGQCFRVGDRNNNIIDNGTPNQEFSERRIRSGAANPTTRITNSGNNVNLCAPVQQIANTGNVANEQGVIPGSGFGFIPAYGSRTDGFFGNDGRFAFPDNDRFVVLGDRDGFFDDGRFNDGRFNDGFNRNGDIDLEGSSINVDGTLNSDCTQTISQAAAAGPGAAATAGGAQAAASPGVVATAGGAVAAAPAGGGAPVAAPVAVIAGGGGAPAAAPAARAGGMMLPSTGGPAIASVLALGAGVLLVGGGLLSYRRFMR